jgi:hypothetical protein
MGRERRQVHDVPPVRLVLTEQQVLHSGVRRVKP